MRLSEEETPGLWYGATGLCLLVLMVIVSIGFCWFGWVGRPLDLTASGRSQRLLSRTGFEDAYRAGPALWTASCVVSGATFLSIPLIAGVIVYYRLTGPTQPRGRSYRTPTILIMLFGVIVGPIGSLTAG